MHEVKPWGGSCHYTINHQHLLFKTQILLKQHNFAVIFLFSKCLGII